MHTISGDPNEAKLSMAMSVFVAIVGLDGTTHPCCPQRKGICN